MYAVIKTGGKQYRVKAGDLLVVEKLEGEPGADVRFGEVLMLGDGGEVTLGAPTVAGAVVTGTLIETRKGQKIKIFKKIRRQGYRRTKGHRQVESVVRVTALGIDGGKMDKWEGKVDLTPKAELDARARNLTITVKKKAEAAPKPAADEAPAKAEAAPKAAKPKAEKAEAAPAKAKAVPKAKAEPKADVEPKKAAPKKAAPKKDKDEG